MTATVTTKGGDVRGDQEEGDQEGCQEEEVVSATSRWGRHPPAALMSLFIHFLFVKVGFEYFFSIIFYMDAI